MIECLFFISVYALVHSYLLYPLLLWLLSIRGKHPAQAGQKNWPSVSVLVAAYNEKEHIARKIESVLQSDYPADKLEIIVGSDGSTDGTDQILKSIAEKDKRVRFILITDRKGKSATLNRLTVTANGKICVMTDAKVYFEPSTLKHLLWHFGDEQTGLVGANIISKNKEKDGIAQQEMAFMSREIRMKYREGQIWGSTIGAYGACYAMRKELYRPVPEDYSVDDFFITMQVLRQGKKAIMELDARCYENVPGQVQAEFRRKLRIAVGNYQNLAHFAGLMWPPWKGRAFAFISHKVLRWLGPFFILLALGLNTYLAYTHVAFAYMLAGQGFLILASITDYLLRKIGIHVVLLRFISHFYHMNLALLAGFVMYIKGKRTNVWEPTKRKQY